MENEKRSNSLMDKMDGLSGLPGDAAFNREAAWNRLQPRLPEQRASRKMVWWWAAAVILILCISPFLLKDRSRAVMPAPALVNSTTLPKPAPVITPDTIAQEKPVPVILAKAKQVSKMTDAVVIPPSDTLAITQPLVAAVPRQDSPLIQSTAATIPPKKRVVHINEVGGDVIGNTYIYPEHKQFKVAISGPAGFASQIVADKPSNTSNLPKN
ncbi:hypothetical protein [Chitinophaga rhizophila]|uniref:Uncharacterized protein n=1 Tax=Chitinophaga rhizophila TaxID=2866212 RepID=A0ABS7G857_9BACT|nr:hypothetical protein [Chitinophaga rhizophila]MBW8683846.1 hypothetical protein [Chitinophaga rhizophila]